jgi:CRP-like cAMP-binding protein
MRQLVSAGANPALAKLDGFAPLPEADRALLRAITAEHRWVTPASDLIRQDEPAEGAFVVLEGFACRYKLRRSGMRQITGYLVPGDIGGLDAAALAWSDHAVGTLSPCRVARIAPETVGALHARPGIAAALRISGAVDAAIAREWLVSVGRRSAPERLAHLFCELHVRLQAVGLVSEDGYPLPVTQIDLADTAGLTSVHVNRSLQDMRREGLIELRKRRLRILDLPRLRALAEFDPAYLQLTGRETA